MTKYLDLSADPLEGTAQRPWLTLLELGQAGALGLVALGDEGEIALILLDVGLGVLQRRPQAEQEKAAVGPDPGDPTGDIDPVVVRVEGVGEIDADPFLLRCQAHRARGGPLTFSASVEAVNSQSLNGMVSRPRTSVGSSSSLPGGRISAGFPLSAAAMDLY